MPSLFSRLLPVGLFVVLVAQAPASPAGQSRSIPTTPRRWRRAPSCSRSSVRGMLQAKCVKCHSGERIEGEFDMGTPRVAAQGRRPRPGRRAGRPQEEPALPMTAHQKEPHMPHERAKLADADIAKIAEWIDLGAPYDKPFVDKDDAAWTRKVIAAEAQEALGLSAASRASRNPKPEVRNPIDALPARRSWRRPGSSRTRRPTSGRSSAASTST